MRILCLGTGPFAVPTLRTLAAGPHQVIGVVTRPERIDPRRKKLPPPSPMRAAAESLGLPVDAPESINSAEGLDLLRRAAAYLLMVCDYGQILKPAALESTRRGGIKLHGSLLPRHRGAAPVHAAILAGDAETGVSVIRMTPGLDAGPVLAVRRTPIGQHENQLELETRLAELGAAAVVEAIERLERWDGVAPLGESQDPALVTLAPRLKKEQGEIDWTATAEVIDRQIRALQPWPGASGYLRRALDAPPLRVLIERAEPIAAAAGSLPSDETSLLTGTASSREPGAILAASRDGIVVRCGDATALCVRRLKPEGKRSMEVGDFLNGLPLADGARFVSSPSDDVVRTA